MTRKILITSALPYANGAIHLGHLVEYIQTDIWVRFQKMQLDTDVYYVCADDTHGTPIMLRAEAEGVTPEELITRMHAEHLRDFKGFQIEFDNYHSTHSPETKKYAYDMYSRLSKAGLIEKRTIEQLYDPVKNMFLPDRFIKGECPKCHSKDQYGDACEVCGSAYSPADLINPYSVVSGTAPVKKESEHYFFKLDKCEEFLKKWTQTGEHLQPEAVNKLKEWFVAGLQDWDISRDAPYFGFPIPGTNDQKFFYVWLDAPVGYMGSFKNLCDSKLSAISGRSPDDIFADFWKKDSPTELYHFIGKDILYFHALFWPAMLAYSGCRTPTKIFAHGFLTVNGEKMSKSRGTFITAESCLKLGLNPEWLRYYYAAKLNGTMEDIDLNLNDFVARVNSDLVGKYVNIASRAAGLLTKHFEGKTADLSGGQLLKRGGTPQQFRHRLIQELVQESEAILTHYDNRRFGFAISSIMSLADKVNQYWDQQKPWDKAKHLSDSGQKEGLHIACSAAVESFRLLTIFLKPVLPKVAAAVEHFLNVKPFSWEDVPRTLTPGHQINPYEHLISRVDPKQITALIEANK
jgi:methionyl-tRNA synthetase